MKFLYTDEDATRQTIDSITAFLHLRRLEREARSYSGGMYWKKQAGYEYLVKTGLDNKQKRIGPRNADTEVAYAAFVTKKNAVEEKLKTIKQAVAVAERKNRPVRAARTPTIVVDILASIHAAGLSEHFTVVGTHALYAYETAAGVRIVGWAAQPNLQQRSKKSERLPGRTRLGSTERNPF